MHCMNEYLAKVPFDLYQLHLFRLVALHQSFTRAAESAGITQSAVTRQIQSMESCLGVELLERTTRKVIVSPAGEFLLQESHRILGDVDEVFSGLRNQFSERPKVIRIGISQSLSLAHLPGLFHANQRRMPNVQCQVSRTTSQEVIHRVSGQEMDIGVIAVPKKLPKILHVLHRFRDDFVLVVPSSMDMETPFSRDRLEKWVQEQNWLLMTKTSETGRQFSEWMESQGWKVEAFMELDDFDLILNLVALGMGVGWVPIRTLAFLPRKHEVRRVNLKQRFHRDLAVITRFRKNVEPHLQEFQSNILF